ncbi:hypothetical protein DPMN_032810 [Dreissena polymorpha]|uniref:Uncharacterized protein n=1 Tax=Dreissena polymorpha TaxID=45954 RepID=A0A9D4RIB1_DREPO|nr:hypothetical protein DPMN_032810 [Dreissena polymorpha]
MFQGRGPNLGPRDCMEDALSTESDEVLQESNLKLFLSSRISEKSTASYLKALLILCWFHFACDWKYTIDTSLTRGLGILTMDTSLTRGLGILTMDTSLTRGLVLGGLVYYALVHVNLDVTEFPS